MVSKEQLGYRVSKGLQELKDSQGPQVSRVCKVLQELRD
jgi:hypothetical protein